MSSKRTLEREVEQLKETSTDERIVILRKDGDGCKDSITGERWDNHPEDVDADLIINITDAEGSLV